MWQNLLSNFVAKVLFLLRYVFFYIFFSSSQLWRPLTTGFIRNSFLLLLLLLLFFFFFYWETNIFPVCLFKSFFLFLNFCYCCCCFHPIHSSIHLTIIFAKIKTKWLMIIFRYSFKYYHPPSSHSLITTNKNKKKKNFRLMKMKLFMEITSPLVSSNNEFL